MDLKTFLHGSIEVPQSYGVAADPLVPSEIIPEEWRTWERYLEHGGRVLKKEKLGVISLGGHVKLFIPKDCPILAEGGEHGFVKRWAANTKRVFFCDGCPRACQHKGKTLVQ